MFGKNNQPEPEFEYFTIFDSKTRSYREPILAINRHDLLRQVQNMFLDPKEQQKNPLYINAEDFSIFKIGEFDKKSGVITSTKQEHIANLHEIRASVEKDVGPRAL